MNLNVCINLSNLGTMSDNQQSEIMLRTLQFLSQKDQELLIKYNKISQILKNLPENASDIFAAYNVTLDSLKNIGVCICSVNYKGYRCQTRVPDLTPNQCGPNMNGPACNMDTSIYRPSSFLLNNNLQAPNGLINQYNSYYCECTSNGIIGLNCEYKSTQCNANLNAAPQFLGSLTNQTSVCNPSK